jgi:hypothetical protein
VGLEVKLWSDNKADIKDTEKYQELIPPIYMDRHRISSTHEHVALVYFATTDSNDIHESETEKSECLKWFSRDELISTPDIPHNIVYYGIKALETLGDK